MHRNHRLNRLNREKAFTLSEVTMSVGIVAAVLLPILGLLATGSRLTANSQDNTAAATIVESITGGLRYDGNQKTDPVLSLGNMEKALDSSGATPVFAAFSAPGEFLRFIDPAEYQSGLSGDSNALYLAEITLEPVSPIRGGIIRKHPLLNLTVEVDAPALAAESARSTTLFHSRIGSP